MFQLRILLLLLLALPAWAANDPLQSVMWDYLHKTFLNGEPVQFDDSILVLLPKRATDGERVPVLIDARSVKDARQMMIIADNNPIPRALTVDLIHAQPRLAVSIRLDQGTPVRVAVKDGKGVWHVAGDEVKAPGGGCSTPSATRGTIDWDSMLGKTTGRTWKEDDGSTRLKLSIYHPMDTGFVPGLDKFNLDQITVKDSSGQPLVKLQPDAAMSENPVITLFFGHSAPGPWLIESSDTKGHHFKQSIVLNLPDAQS